MNENIPILMTENYWASSQFSVARYYGNIRCWGRRYVVVNKEGVDVFTLSAQMKGDGKIIPPGEPADLIWDKMIPAYKTLGRDRFIEALQYHLDDKQIRAYARSKCETIGDFLAKGKEAKK